MKLRPTGGGRDDMSDQARFRHYRLKGRKIGAGELADLFGVEHAQVRRWVQMGAPTVPAAPGIAGPRFDCTEVTRWLIESGQAPPQSANDSEPLPPSAQEIADVIGRQRTLQLIGQLPPSPGRNWRVCLYVPKRLGPDHPLVQMVGWHAANLLVREFGGMILQPSNCRILQRRWRHREVLRMHQDGASPREIADVVELSPRQVANIIAAQQRQA